MKETEARSSGHDELKCEKDRHRDKCPTTTHTHSQRSADQSTHTHNDNHHGATHPSSSKMARVVGMTVGAQRQGTTRTGGGAHGRNWIGDSSGREMLPTTCGACGGHDDEPAACHTGGEKSFSARDRVRDLRGMARVACFTMNANSCHPTTHHSPQPAIRLTHSLQLRQSFVEIVVPALRSWCWSKITNAENRKSHWWHARSYSRPSVGWITETLGRQFPRMPAWDLVVPLGGTAVVASYVQKKELE
jgi:hypothetical protein